jgi:hypothetical protein
MRNRLPKEYAITDPDGLRPAGAPPLESRLGPKPGMRERVVDAAANSIGAHPVASLGAALLVGIILGKLVKR